MSDSETLLLVHHEKAKILEFHVVRKKPVRSDHDVDFTVCYCCRGAFVLGV